MQFYIFLLLLIGRGVLSMKLNRAVSVNTVYRLPKYIRLLDEMEKRGIDRISSSNIGQLLGLTPSQVRQDLSSFGSYGAQGYGYSVHTLKEELKIVMGLNRTHNIVFMGLGSIGTAFLCHMNFRDNNYSVVAAFDVREDLIGTEVNHTKVLHPSELAAVHKETPIDICILAIPAEKAKDVAKEISRIGIPAIWNLTNVDLGLNDSKTVVEDIHFLDSLYSLTFYLKEERISKA